MFDRLLIANRGEIACRIIRTARAMGLGTVAVHSDVDAGALHVQMADVAVALGGRTPAESYLRQDALIAAAKATGAGAIHPGYGFLSENPEFAEAVEAAGLVFVGPSARAIRAMGLKDAAKRLMAEAGVPVVPGYHGEDQRPEHLAAQAAEIGYPVLIKAVAGGGGKGMRRVDSAPEFEVALRAAQAEARGAFGNDAVLIEKYVSAPRHIEVQVFGDGTRAVHLFERDCSLQRRHQKVIEEAPAPGMTPEMRDAMGQAAVRAAEAIGYRGAGTVEFIVDGSEGLRPDRFWFMEMNTRLQVEHPVTEAITGVDLVAWQLTVAAGGALPCAQEDLSIRGHAIEARLYAEDAGAGFLPATGRLAHLRFPEGLRADTGVQAGDEISPYYDPMLAKLIAHGPTREVALRQLRRGLGQTEVAGTVTNLAFLGALLDHEDVRAARLDTGLIGRDLAQLVVSPTVEARHWAQAALIAAGLWARVPDALAGFALWQPVVWPIALRQGEAEGICKVSRAAGGWRVETPEGAVTALWQGAGWRLDGQGPVSWHRTGPEITLFADPAVCFAVVDPLERAAAAQASDGVTRAPMPGRVVALCVAPGDTVVEGAVLAVMEAMKMEHSLRAERAGTVAEVFCPEGAQVSGGTPLIRLEEDG